MSSLPISTRVYKVGIPCTSSCTVELSNWTVVVPEMRWRNCNTLLLSEEAFTVSMVMRVRLLVGRHTTRCIRVAWREELTLSLMAMTEVGRGEPSRLMMSRRSRCVMALLGGEGSLVAAGAVAGGIFPGWVVGFLALLVT